MSGNMEVDKDIDLSGTIFTRGSDVPEKRGESMVQIHAAKVQRAKEDAAIAKVRAALPETSPAVLLLALEENDWEVEPTLWMLKNFAATKQRELAILHEKLQQLTSSMAGNAGSGKRERPPEAEIDDNSSSEEEERGRKRSKKDQKGRHKKEKRTGKEKKAAKEKRKKDKEVVRPGETAFGKYGIIREADRERMHSEFALWAVETQKIELEAMPKVEERELFKTFMEDFNTGTLPHRKYYNLQAHERRAAERAARGREPDEEEAPVLNDEEALHMEIVRARKQAQEERLREAYNELKYTNQEKAADMREQELMRAQMNLAYRTGDHATATQIAERLKPDEVREREANRKLLEAELAQAKQQG